MNAIENALKNHNYYLRGGGVTLDDKVYSESAATILKKIAEYKKRNTRATDKEKCEKLCNLFNEIEQLTSNNRLHLDFWGLGRGQHRR